MEAPPSSRKIALATCPDYGAGVDAAVKRVVDLLGGIERFAKPGQSVLIKPNLLTDREPAAAVTTHPSVVAVLIRLLKARGARVSVADSPASVVKLERVWERTGFKELCDQEGIPLVNLEKAGSRQFTLDGGTFSIARPVLDADVIINVPKVKTHMLTTFTGAVKNLYGTVPGFQKTVLHKQYPTPRDFGTLLAEIYRAVPPQLSVADAIVGMEGEGPSSGQPVPLGFVAACEDAVALDYGLCSILGITPRSVPYLETLRKQGDGHPATIEFVGASPADVRPAGFRTPSSLVYRLIPTWLVRPLQPLLWIRPVVADTCIRCGRCVEACPVDALRMKTKTSNEETADGKPVLDPAVCIGCCCCHEVCPVKAVSMQQSPLLGALRGGRMP